MKNNIYTSTIIIILLLGLGIFFSLKSTPPEEKLDATQEEVRQEVEADKETLKTPVTATRYENTKYGFSFEKPDGYTVGVIRDDFGETLLVQNAKISSGFQIYITPLDGPTVVTKEQIQKDLPGTTVVNSKALTLDGKASGLMFESNNSSMPGGSFEIWFIYPESVEGVTAYLYQVSSYKAFAPELQKIMNTWNFKN